MGRMMGASENEYSLTPTLPCQRAAPWRVLLPDPCWTRLIFTVLGFECLDAAGLGE